MTPGQLERHWERLERERIWLECDMDILWLEAQLARPEVREYLEREQHKAKWANI